MLELEISSTYDVWRALKPRSMKPRRNGYPFLVLRTIAHFLRSMYSQIRVQIQEMVDGVRYTPEVSLPISKSAKRAQLSDSGVWPSEPGKGSVRDKTLVRMGPTYWLLNPSIPKLRKLDTVHRAGGVGILSVRH